MRVVMTFWLLASVGCTFSAPPLETGASDAGTSGPRDAGGATGSDGAPPDATVDPVAVARINIAGPAHQGSEFLGTWDADPGDVCSGPRYTNEVEIHGTSDDPLFQHQLYADPVACAVGSGLPAGDYRVRILMGEVYRGPGCPNGGPGAGERLFDIIIEGTTVTSGIDVYNESGGCVASTTITTSVPLVKTYDVQLTDGTLDVELNGTLGNGILSAIEVLRL